MSVQYVKQFNADQGELSLSIDGGKHWKQYKAGKIQKIRRTTANKKFLFMTKPVERLEIIINGEPQPYVIEKGVIKDDFEWITDVLKRFSEKNKVEFEA